MKLNDYLIVIFMTIAIVAIIRLFVFSPNVEKSYESDVYSNLVIGDLNFDGVVDITDLTILANKVQEERVADFDNNYVVDGRDVDSLQSFLFGTK